MINLPDFTEQKMYDYETFYHLTMNLDRVSKYVIHYEAMKMVQNIPGAVIECGVFKGTSFARFSLFRELFGNFNSKKLIAFDVFSDDFPDTKFEEDKKIREDWINTAGGSSISADQLSMVLDRNEIKNYQLIEGDVLNTIPQYVNKNKGLKISLLNIDIDFVEPTYCALENLYPLVMPGGIVLLDNYAGESPEGIALHGDTKGVDDYFNDKDIKIRQFPFAGRPCYIIKE